MMRPNEIHALKLAETQLPIAISGLGSKGNSQSLSTLHAIAIKMFETRRRRLDPSEVFQMNAQSGPAEIVADHPTSKSKKRLLTIWNVPIGMVNFPRIDPNFLQRRDMLLAPLTPQRAAQTIDSGTSPIARTQGNGKKGLSFLRYGKAGLF